ncbi:MULTISPECIES: hypothetical protein [unclassified Coleofasciculus]|uniref:hypothetical protein n=1 Tax=unclassified Coleofasciculus TaxID=2692782 RepID=UPI0018804024|nr:MULTISPECIES: hypothetical protein [unclassified Coleofasciculus]MBE9128743.1 hypothetical protein [Coleofasciculus sp. LEGE 07081]MBE9150845.1 hypothetical protein [Coleofasciculus sp. LEGE 07092]
MNYKPEMQPYLAQQPQAEPQTTSSIEPIEPIPLTQLDPATLLHYGGVTVAVILAIALLILALTEYNKVFVSGMQQKHNDLN